MQVKEAIILAGGRGTRLSSVLPYLPKPIAPVGGKAFLNYQFAYLEAQGIQRIILSVGYRREQIMELLGDSYHSIELCYVSEETPLGTGGALELALKEVNENEVAVLNGDTYFPIDLSQLLELHLARNADLTLSLRKLEDGSRFGSVIVRDNLVLEFLEKGKSSSGLVNGGVYVMKSDLLTKQSLKSPYSFETDAMPLLLKSKRVIAERFNSYFIDLGIPEDYERAQRECLNW